MPLPPPSAFPRLTPPSRTTPRFFLYTAADRTTTGLTTHPIYTHPSVDHLIHPFFPTPYTIDQSAAETVATEICDELAERNLYLSSAETTDSSGQGYAGSLTIQNRCSCNPAYYHRANASDLLAPWGVPSVSETYYTPYQSTGITSTAAISDLLASALQFEATSRGLCIPLYMHDDDEGPDQAGLSNAIGLKFTDSGSTGSGWWSQALADPRRSTDPILYDPRTSSLLTLDSILSLYPPPAIGDPSGFWSASSNRAFSNWLWALTSAIAATTQYRGPNSGFRTLFPSMEFSEYALVRAGGGPSTDLQLPAFGSTNDYSILRPTAPFPFALPWTAQTHSQGSCSSLTTPRLPRESISAFYIRQAYTNALADPSPSKAIWLNAVNSTLTYRSSSGTSSFTLSPALFTSLCCTLLHAGVTSFILFIPDTPYAHWSDLLTCINNIQYYARSGPLPLPSLSRPSTLTRLFPIPSYSRPTPTPLPS